MNNRFIIFVILTSILASHIHIYSQEINIANSEKKNITGVEFKNDLVYLNLNFDNGEVLRFLTDTGGGRIITAKAVEKLKFKVDTLIENGQQLMLVNLNEELKKRQLPTSLTSLIVFNNEIPFDLRIGGMLGADWFGNKIWDFDYFNKKLFVLDSINWEDLTLTNKVEIGFLSDDLGNSITHFPRIPIVVMKDTIQTLFDTGATVILTKNAQNKFNSEKILGTSFIITSIFDKWRSENPEWSFIEKGDSMMGEDMILVPEVTIGKNKVGPVWFTRRPDGNFTQYMSQWMDKPVSGAIGGSSLKYFRSIIIDYKKRFALFQQ